MSKYIVTALEIVKILGLEETDENITKYIELVKDKSYTEKYVEQAITICTPITAIEQDFNKGAK